MVQQCWWGDIPLSNRGNKNNNRGLEGDSQRGGQPRSSQWDKPYSKKRYWPSGLRDSSRDTSTPTWRRALGGDRANFGDRILGPCRQPPKSQNGYMDVDVVATLWCVVGCKTRGGAAASAGSDPAGGPDSTHRTTRQRGVRRLGQGSRLFGWLSSPP